MKKNLMAVALMTPLISAANNDGDYLPVASPPTQELRLINMNAIISLAPQSVAFRGNDHCKYYGTTKDANQRGVTLTNKVCFNGDREFSQFINKRAWLVEFKNPGSVYTLIPSGNIWSLTDNR